MKWKDYVGSTDLIRTTIPTLPGGIDKKHKKIIIIVSIAAKIRTTHVPITSENPSARHIQPSVVQQLLLQLQLQQQQIENHNVEVTKIKRSSKIFPLSRAFWCPTWRR